VIEALEDLGHRHSVKVIVGGVPITKSWAGEIGADGYSEDAISAVKVSKQLLDVA
jgi:dimethylamine corrinoid protein